MKLSIGIDVTGFAAALARDVLTGGVTVVDSTERLLGAALEESVSAAIGQRFAKPPEAVVHRTYFRQRFETLRGLSNSGYETWYPEVRFATACGEDIDVDGIEPHGFATAPILYARSVKKMFQFTKKRLRTQTNHCLRLNKVRIAPAVFDDAIALVERGPMITQPLIANLTIEPRIRGFRLVAFDHVLTGERVFCDCHRSAHDKMLEDARVCASRFVRGSWPHQLIDVLRAATYVGGICHLCVASANGPSDGASSYGDSVQSHPEAYVDLLTRRDGLDAATAKAEVSAQLGFARWVREAELHKVVKKLFPGAAVRREASPSWLGRQRLDIYLPELCLAIEHQGVQHFEAVPLFGGEDALERTKARDDKKNALCAENGVAVVAVRFDEPLTLPYLRRRLRRWMRGPTGV